MSQNDAIETNDEFEVDETTTQPEEVLAKKDAEIERLKAQLRNKEVKQMERQEEVQEETQPITSVVDEDALVEKLAIQLEAKKAAKYKETGFEWLTSQEWGKEYAQDATKLNAMLKTINEQFPPDDDIQYKKNLQRAHLALKGADNISESHLKAMADAAESIQYASGASGSDVRHDTVDTTSTEAKDFFSKMGVTPEMLEKVNK